MQFDFRSVYASIFKEWFEADDTAIEQVLFDNFETLPILKKDATKISNHKAEDEGIQLYPNPVIDFATIAFIVQEERATLQIFSSEGKKLSNLFSRTLTAGKHEFTLDFSHLPAGSYYLAYINGLHRTAIPFLKL